MNHQKSLPPLVSAKVACFGCAFSERWHLWFGPITMPSVILGSKDKPTMDDLVTGLGDDGCLGSKNGANFELVL
jgi:hypothetical protein